MLSSSWNEGSFPVDIVKFVAADFESLLILSLFYLMDGKHKNDGQEEEGNTTLRKFAAQRRIKNQVFRSFECQKCLAWMNPSLTSE